MTLLEAMRSGRRFKSETQYGYMKVDENGYVVYGNGIRLYVSERVLTFDYELEPLPEKKVEVTESQFNEALAVAYFRCRNILELSELLKKELGL